VAEQTEITSFRDTQLNDQMYRIGDMLELIAERLAEISRALGALQR